MPLDVLQKIQGAMQDGNINAEVRGQVSGILDVAQQNPSMQSGISGIANAVTGNGENITPETMAQLAKVGTAFAKAMEQANLAMLGIHGSFNAIDTSPLENANESIMSIAENGRDIQIGINAGNALKNIIKLAGEIDKMRSKASSGIDFTAHSTVFKSVKSQASTPVKNSANAFAKGGKVTYDKQNTETAQTGGIFRKGSSSGDRNMIFANKGEGIITAYAISQGAKQRGMSPERYVQALNHPSANVEKIKKGRSFKYGGKLVGGGVTPPMAGDALNEFKDLIDYLQGSKFHGNEPAPASFSRYGATVQEVFDTLVGSSLNFSHYNANQVKNNLKGIAKNIEKEYDRQTSRTMEGIKTSPTNPSSTGAPVMGMDTASGHRSTATLTVEANKNVYDSSRPIPTGGLTHSTGTDEEHIGNIKKSLSRSISSVTSQYNALDEEGQGTLKGHKLSDLKGNLSDIQQIFTGTIEEITAFCSYIKEQFPGFDTEQLIALLNKASNDFDHLTDDELKELKNLGFIAKNFDIKGLQERLGKGAQDALDKLLQEIAMGLENGSLKDIVASMNYGDLLDTVANKEKNASGDEQKYYHDILKLVSTAKRSPAVTSVLEGELANSVEKKIKDKINNRITSAEQLNEALKNNSIDSKNLKILSELCNGIESMSHAIEAAETKVGSFGDAWKQVTKVNEYEIQRELTNIPLIGKAFNGNVVGTMAYAAAVAFVMSRLKDLAKLTSDFVIKQAELSKNFTIASQSLNTFSGKSQSLDVLARGLNMSREQAVALGSAMQDVALKGVQGVDTVTTIANNLKNTLGKVDTSLLKEAVNLINDLPKEQVDVMIKGTGSFDDKANLIANLMNDGNLEKSINLMMNGAFGEMDGSVHLDEKDKAVIEAQERANMILDEINKGIYNFIPKWMATDSVQYTKIIGSLVSQIVSLKMLHNISRNVASILRKRENPRPPSSTPPPPLLRRMSRSISTGISNRFASFKNPVIPGGGGGGMNWGNIMGAVGQAASVFAVVKGGAEMMSEAWESLSKRIKAKKAVEYKQNRQENIDKYGNSVGRAGLDMEKNWGVAAEEAGAVASALGTVAGAAVAAGVAIGAFTAGIGTAIGLVVAGIASLGAFVLSSGLDDRSAFTHKEERGFINGKIFHMFGDNYSTELDENAKERAEYYKEALDKLDQIHKSNGKKGRDELLKEMITLNKHVKAIEMITKGRFTAFDENNFNTDLDLLKQQSSIGGTDKDFSETRKRAFSTNARSYETQANALSKQKMKIMTNPELSTEAKANALNKVISEETKMHKKFIDNMNNVINSLGETPSIIISGLKQQLNDAFSNMNAANFVDNSGMARMNAQEDMKNTAENVSTLFADYQSANREINNTMKRIDASIARNEQLLKNMQDSTGIKSADEARANIDRIHEKEKEFAGDNAEYIAVMDEINSYINKANDATRGTGNDQNKINDAASELSGQLPTIIQQLEEAKKIAQEKGDKKFENEIDAKLTRIKSVQGRVNKGETGDELNKEIVNAVGSMYAAGTEMKLLIDNLQEVSNKLSNSDKELKKQSRTFEMAARAMQSLKDTSVAKQKAKTDNGEQYLKKLKAESDKFLSSMNAVLNNGAVQFAKAMREVFEKAEEYDLFGGIDAAFSTMDASIAELEESLKAVKDAKDLVDTDKTSVNIENVLTEYLNKQEEEINKEIKELEKNDGSLAEKQICDVSKSIYDEMVKFHEDMVKEKEKQAIGEADRKLGETLKKDSDNFSEWNDDDAQQIGFKSKAEMQGASAKEVGEKIRKYEETLVEAVKKKYASEHNGAELSTEEARKRVRGGSEGTADRYGDNSTWILWRESDREKAYKDAMKENDVAVDKARKDSAAEMPKRDFKSLDEIKAEERKKIESKLENLKKEALSTSKGKEYADLVAKTMRAQQAYMKNPNGGQVLTDKNGNKTKKSNKEIYEQAKEKQREFEDNNGDKLNADIKNAINAFAAAQSQNNVTAMKALQAESEWKSKFMAVFKQIPSMLEKIAMNGKSIALMAEQGKLESKQSYVNKYEDVGKAVGMKGSVMANASALMKSRMSSVEDSENVKKMQDYKDEMVNMYRSQGKSKQDIANLEQALDAKIVQAKYDAEMKIKDEYIQSLQKAMDSSMAAIDRSNQGLEIEKDLYETIGAPFEYILDVEQEMVRNAKAKAEAEETLLAEMEKNGIQGAALEEQKLKVQKASAEVIKASFGAQRDSLDKLLGKMMNGFEQVGGIFGPDSDFMKARKAGQGYTQLPSGMISASGGTVSDYVDKAASLQGAAAGMKNGVKTHRGDTNAFGGSKDTPFRAQGGFLGDWISNATEYAKSFWNPIGEGMNNTVGGISGDTGNAITEGGNKVHINRKEAVFNYDTLMALAEPFGESPEKFVNDAINGDPYGIYATTGTFLGDDGNNKRIKKAKGVKMKDYSVASDRRSDETDVQYRERIEDESLTAYALLGAYKTNYTDKGNAYLTDSKGEVKAIYTGDKFIEPDETIIDDKSVKNNPPKITKENAKEKMNEAIRNDAFGGGINEEGENNVAGTSVNLNTVEKLLLGIMEDTHKLLESFGVEVDWRKFNKLADKIEKKDTKQKTAKEQVDDVVKGTYYGKTESEIKEKIKDIDKKAKKGNASKQEIAAASKMKDEIASRKLEAMGKSEKGSDKKSQESKSVALETLETDKETLKYVKLIFEMLGSISGTGVNIAGYVNKDVNNDAKNAGTSAKNTNAISKNAGTSGKDTNALGKNAGTSDKNSGVSGKETGKDAGNVKEEKNRNIQTGYVPMASILAISTVDALSKVIGKSIANSKNAENGLNNNTSKNTKNDQTEKNTKSSATDKNPKVNKSEQNVKKEESVKTEKDVKKEDKNVKQSDNKDDVKKGGNNHGGKSRGNRAKRASEANFQKDFKKNPERYGVTRRDGKVTFTTEDGVKHSMTSRQFEKGYNIKSGMYQGKAINGNQRVPASSTVVGKPQSPQYTKGNGYLVRQDGSVIARDAHGNKITAASAKELTANYNRDKTGKWTAKSNTQKLMKGQDPFKNPGFRDMFERISGDKVTVKAGDGKYVTMSKGEFIHSYDAKTGELVLHRNSGAKIQNASEWQKNPANGSSSTRMGFKGMDLFNDANIQKNIVETNGNKITVHTADGRYVTTTKADFAKNFNSRTNEYTYHDDSGAKIRTEDEYYGLKKARAGLKLSNEAAEARRIEEYNKNREMVEGKKPGKVSNFLNRTGGRKGDIAQSGGQATLGALLAYQGYKTMTDDNANLLDKTAGTFQLVNGGLNTAQGLTNLFKSLFTKNNNKVNIPGLDKLNNAAVALNVASTTWKSISSITEDMTYEEYQALKERKKSEGEFCDLFDDIGKMFSFDSISQTAGMGALTGLLGGTGAVAGTTAAISTAGLLMLPVAVAAVAKHVTNNLNMKEWEEKEEDMMHSMNYERNQQFSDVISDKTGVSRSSIDSLARFHRTIHEANGRVYNKTGEWIDNFGGSRNSWDKDLMLNSENNATAQQKANDDAVSFVRKTAGMHYLKNGNITAWKNNKKQQHIKINDKILWIEENGDTNSPEYQRLLENREKLSKAQSMSADDAVKLEKELDDEERFKKHKSLLTDSEEFKNRKNKIERKINELKEKRKKNGSLSDKDNLALTRLNGSFLNMKSMEKSTNWKEMKEAEDRETTSIRQQFKNGEVLDEETKKELHERYNFIMGHRKSIDGFETLSDVNDTEANQIKNAYESAKADMTGPSELAIANAKINRLNSQQALEIETYKKLKEEAELFAEQNKDKFSSKEEAKKAFMKEAARQRSIGRRKNIEDISLTKEEKNRVLEETIYNDKTDKENLADALEEKKKRKQDSRDFIDKINKTNTKTNNSEAYDQLLDEEKTVNTLKGDLEKTYKKVYEKKKKELRYGNIRYLDEHQKEQLERAINNDKDYAALNSKFITASKKYNRHKRLWNKYGTQPNNLNEEQRNAISEILTQQKNNQVAWNAAFKGSNGEVTCETTVSNDVWKNALSDALALSSPEAAQKKAEELKKAADDAKQKADKAQKAADEARQKASDNTDKNKDEALKKALKKAVEKAEDDAENAKEAAQKAENRSQQFNTRVSATYGNIQTQQSQTQQSQTQQSQTQQSPQGMTYDEYISKHHEYLVAWGKDNTTQLPSELKNPYIRPYTNEELDQLLMNQGTSYGYNVSQNVGGYSTNANMDKFGELYDKKLTMSAKEENEREAKRQKRLNRELTAKKERLKRNKFFEAAKSNPQLMADLRMFGFAKASKVLDFSDLDKQIDELDKEYENKGLKTNKVPDQEVKTPDTSIKTQSTEPNNKPKEKPAEELTEEAIKKRNEEAVREQGAQAIRKTYDKMLNRTESESMQTPMWGLYQRKLDYEKYLASDGAYTAKTKSKSFNSGVQALSRLEAQKSANDSINQSSDQSNQGGNMNVNVEVHLKMDKNVEGLFSAKVCKILKSTNGMLNV